MDIIRVLTRRKAIAAGLAAEAEVPAGATHVGEWEHEGRRVLVWEKPGRWSQGLWNGAEWVYNTEAHYMAWRLICAAEQAEQARAAA